MNHILLINNKDSFVFNLKAEFERLGCNVTVVANDVSVHRVVTWLRKTSVSAIVYSPGPGRPEQSGLTLALMNQFAGAYPMLGVCLGMQAMAVNFGGLVGASGTPMHGKSTPMVWRAHPFSKPLPQQMRVARYHSLVISRMPQGFLEIAESDGYPMAIIDEQRKMLGLQFHPESILTEQGTAVLQQFLSFWGASSHE